MFSNLDQRRIPRSGCGAKMAEALAFEKADEHGNSVKHLTARPPGNLRKVTTKVTKQRADVAAAESSDDEDDDYEEPEAASSPRSNAGDDLIPSNAEVSFIVLLLTFHFLT